MSYSKIAQDGALAHWQLLAEIEMLEELIAENRQSGDADDELAVHAVSLARALQLRRRALRTGQPIAN